MGRMTLEQVEAHQRRVGRAPAVRKPTLLLTQQPAKESAIEALFAQQIEAKGLPKPEREFKGAVPGRKFRLDFAYPDRRICVEVQGMVHRIKARFRADTERTSLLVVNGWRVLPVSGDDVRSGRAVQWLEILLAIVYLRQG